ncbi:MAG: hypothetical protein HON90_16610 [Halobacteriovoraceae bacterium]|nr:hypothetical protein [Halobacteriovoraceae bacterium]
MANESCNALADVSAAYYSKTLVIKNNKRRLSFSTKLRLKQLLKQNVAEAKKILELNLNLIAWPVEDRLIYTIGEKILKER